VSPPHPPLYSFWVSSCSFSRAHFVSRTPLPQYGSWLKFLFSPFRQGSCQDGTVGVFFFCSVIFFERCLLLPTPCVSITTNEFSFSSLSLLPPQVGCLFCVHFFSRARVPPTVRGVPFLSPHPDVGVLDSVSFSVFFFLFCPFFHARIGGKISTCVSPPSM